MLDGFEKAAHGARMWSMEDVFDQFELDAWIERVRKVKETFTRFIANPNSTEPVEPHLRTRLFKQAITRGDGSIGEDVTQNVKTIASIPLTIEHQGLLEIRGEVVIKKPISSV